MRWNHPRHGQAGLSGRNCRSDRWRTNALDRITRAAVGGGRSGGPRLGGSLSSALKPAQPKVDGRLRVPSGTRQRVPHLEAKCRDRIWRKDAPRLSRPLSSHADHRRRCFLLASNEMGSVFRSSADSSGPAAALFSALLRAGSFGRDGISFHRRYFQLARKEARSHRLLSIAVSAGQSLRLSSCSRVGDRRRSGRGIRRGRDLRQRQTAWRKRSHSDATRSD